ncbi:MAG: hypothetical protein IPI14_12660 [Polaromonas sp.]|nr:hypothetical protein [Polaromonas sp.]
MLPGLFETGIPFHIENQVHLQHRQACDTRRQNHVQSVQRRLRRGILYRVAEELGATKIALGHHRDDKLQTFKRTCFMAVDSKGMLAKLVSDTGNTWSFAPWRM